MRIYVCVKHVPDTAVNIRIVGEAGFDESINFVMNPYDEYALEEAVKTANGSGGEVVAVSVGKAAAERTLRSALALGAHRGILVKTQEQFLDSAATALALKGAIEQDGAPDLVFTGKQSVDSEGMQTHYRLAAALDMPVATEVVSFFTDGGKALVECEKGGGDREVVEMSLPCVIGATKGLNEPRRPKLTDILKAKKKEIKEVALADLGGIPPAGATRVIRLEPVPEQRQARMLTGGTREMVEELVFLLREEAKVL